MDAQLQAEPDAEPAIKKPMFEATVTARGPTTAASASTIRNLDFDLRPHTSPNDVLRVVPDYLQCSTRVAARRTSYFYAASMPITAPMLASSSMAFR